MTKRKDPSELELSITRAIDRHYKKNPALRVSHIRAALKNVDRMLLTMLVEAEPRKWRS
jgi:hypothetical protein